MIRRRDLPQLDPQRLALPKRPKVVEIRTDTYETAIRTEGLEVVVVLDKLTRAQERDYAWARPYKEIIRTALRELGEERDVLILLRSRASDSGMLDEDEGG